MSRLMNSIFCFKQGAKVRGPIDQSYGTDFEGSTCGLCISLLVTSLFAMSCKSNLTARVDKTEGNDARSVEEAKEESQKKDEDHPSGNQQTDPTLPPLKVVDPNLTLTTGGLVTVEAEGGKPPYSYEIVSGSGNIDPSIGILQVGHSREDLVVRITDSTGKSHHQVFPVQQTAINLPFEFASGSIIFSRVSDTHIIYVADTDGSGTKHLYVTPLEGTERQRLTPDFVAGGSVVDARFNHDHSKVIYSADKDVDEEFRVYSVNLDGSSTTKINGTLGAGRSVSFFKVSPTENRVIYGADQDSDDIVELYQVTLGSTTSTKLVSMDHANGDVQSYYGGFTPDGSNYVFFADKSVDLEYNLYSVPVDGGAVTQLNGALAGNDIYLAAITPDSSQIVYLAEEGNGTRTEFYSATIGSSGTSARLHNALPGGDDCHMNNFQISNNSQHIIATCRLSGLTKPVLLTLGATTMHEFHLTAFSLYFTDDSQYVTFVTNEIDGGRWDLYSVSTSSPSSTKVMIDTDANRPGAINVENTNQFFYIKNDGFYKSTAGTAGGTRISPEIPAAATISKVAQSPDRAHLVFVADLEVIGENNIYGFKPEGGDFKQYNSPFTATDRDVKAFGVGSIVFSPDSSKVQFSDDRTRDEQLEIFVSDL